MIQPGKSGVAACLAATPFLHFFRSGALITMLRLERGSWICIAVMALSISVAGCAKQVDDAKRFGPTGKVKGTLTFNGKPVEDARVQFSSKETAAAVIGDVSNGEFELTDPVPVGKYKVAVLPPEEPAPESGVKYQPKQYPDIPLKYRDEFNSDLTAEVHEGDDNEVKLDMKP